MTFRFEKLEVWQEARQFVTLIYTLTKQFPKEEVFGLVAQLRRAALSIISNIAEGSDRGSDVDFRRFLRMSIGSLEEVITQLYIALDQGYINQATFDHVYLQANRLAAMLNSFMNVLSGKP